MDASAAPPATSKDDGNAPAEALLISNLPPLSLDAEEGSGVANVSEEDAGEEQQEDPPQLQQQQQERKRGRPRLIDESKDRLILDAMQQRGTTNARMIQDELARQHSIKLTYEVIRRRVKQLSLHSTAVDLDAARMDTPPQQEPQQSSAGSEASKETETDARSKMRKQRLGRKGDGERAKAESADQRGHQRIARDLDMLAETVRTIVSNVHDQVSESSHASEDGGDSQDAESSGGEEKTANLGRADAALLRAEEKVVGAEPVQTASPPFARGQHGEYSLEICQLCVAKYAEGRTLKQIAEELQMPATSVQTIIKKAKRKGAVLPAQRAGRPRATSDNIEQVIMKLVTSDPALSARSIQEQLTSTHQLDVSFETIRRRVRDCRKKLRDGGGSIVEQQRGQDPNDREDASDGSDDEKERATPASSSIQIPSLPPPANPAAPTTQPATKRRKYGEYSTEVREACVQKHEIEGLTYAAISSELNIPHDTVRAIVRKAKKTGTVRTAPRSGRPRKTSDIVDKVIMQAVKANQRCTAKMIQEDLWNVFNVKVSCETVRRRVKANTKHRLLASSSEQAQHPSPNVSALLSSQLLLGAAATMPPSVQPPHANSAIASLPLPLSIYQPPLSHAALVGTLGGGSHGAIQSILNYHDPSGPAPEASSAMAATNSTPAAPANLVSHPPRLAQEQPRKKRNEYSVELREQCVSLHAQGHGYRRIGLELKMPHTTVRAIVEKVQRTGTVLPAARSGRPRKTDEIVDKVILQAVKNNEKCSARMIQEELLQAYDVQVSCETIRRRVKDHSRQRHSSSTIARGEPVESNRNSGIGSSASLHQVATLPAPGVVQLRASQSFQMQLQGAFPSASATANPQQHPVVFHATASPPFGDYAAF